MERRPTGPLPNVEKPPLSRRVREIVAVAARLVASAPIPLPPKIARIAAYVSLALHLLDGIEDARKDTPGQSGSQAGGAADAD